MSYLIQLSGDAKGCSVTVVIENKFIALDEECEWGVDEAKLEEDGYINAISVTAFSDINVTSMEHDDKSYVKVELPYPWSKTTLVANVPVKESCNNGWIDSILHVISLFLGRN
jgi:hypothetical protein